MERIEIKYNKRNGKEEKEGRGGEAYVGALLHTHDCLSAILIVFNSKLNCASGMVQFHHRVSFLAGRISTSVAKQLNDWFIAMFCAVKPKVPCVPPVE